MVCSVLITLAACVAAFCAWHLFERRDHRGGHARHDAMHSPYAVAERIATEVAREQNDTGRHHLRRRVDERASILLSGEMPLLCGESHDASDQERAGALA